MENTFEKSDEVADSAFSIHTYLEQIFKLADSIVAELGLIAITAKDDNSRELAESVSKKYSNIFEKLDSDINEIGEDWEDYTLSGVTSYMYEVSENKAKQTLLIPALRKSFKSVVEGDFTEEFFQTHLDHFRKQFNLSEKFK